MSTKLYHILEVFQCMVGSFDYVLDLIHEFSAYQGDGLKFQPLHPDMLATPDYQWYSVYKELYFSPDQWRVILGIQLQRLKKFGLICSTAMVARFTSKNPIWFLELNSSHPCCSILDSSTTWKKSVWKAKSLQSM